MKTIQSKSHKIGAYRINKISLSCFANKRYELDDEVKKPLYEHKGINCFD